MTKEEKRRCFREMGVDILIEFPLNAKTAATPAEDFIRDILCGKMHVKYLAAGTDLSFGKGGKGDWHLLQALSGKLDIRRRSSTRSCTTAGKSAPPMCGRRYRREKWSLRQSSSARPTAFPGG